MKFSITFTAPIILVLSTSLFGQQAKLEGRVFNHRNTPVGGARVVSPNGQSGTTDNRGHFTISFSSSVQPGQATRIVIAKANWVIYQPMFGNCVTQNVERNYEPLQVVIVPKGSPLALSPKRLSEVIAQWAIEKTKLNRSVRELSSNLDEYSFIRQYAKEYGFTLEQFRDAAQQWAQIKSSDDKEHQALKEYWRKNYASAAKLAQESALTADDELEQANRRTREASLKVIRRYTLVGNSYYQQDKLREALDAYTEIEKRFEAKALAEEKFRVEWATTKWLIGSVKTGLGERGKGEDSLRLLREAVNEQQQSLTIFTRNQLPEQWAKVQVDLGTTMMALGIRVSGDESIQYLKNGIAALRGALEIIAREKQPQDWSLAQTNLGNVLELLGVRVSGAESIQYLEDASQAHRVALQVLTREQFPEDWAGTQNNLGLVLRRLGERVGGQGSTLYLNDAIAAFRQALQVLTQDKQPRQWALTQMNLGTALTSRGQRIGGVEGIQNLKDAMASHRAALQVFTREQSPQQWAMTQNNLSNSFYHSAQLTSGAESTQYLKHGMTAIRLALEVMAREDIPQQWAMMHDNLANFLSALGERIDGAEGVQYLEDAVPAYQAALQVRTREHFPQDWAATQYNLGNTLASLGNRVVESGSIRYLKDAVAAYRAALEVKEREQFPQDWAEIQVSMGVVLIDLGERVGGAESLKNIDDAVAAYRAALAVQTREHLPQRWVILQGNLGRALFHLKDWSGAAAAYSNVLAIDPDNKDVYELVVSLNHDRLFKFETAFALYQQWMARHPDDIDTKIGLAEAHFTTGRFAECIKQINTLLSMPTVGVRSKTALRSLEIASLLADEKGDQVLNKIDALIEEVSKQPAEFKLTWNFDGSRHFIDQNEKLVIHRVWLAKLFDALATQDRETMLKGLKASRATF
ncbi:MAG TPA: tetratricopeptide repeat protein [Pyrinomonadaceae bacterium]|nr:tetratricopeptide repeat protein [Pyrinomonadaceae bacterium]